MSDQPHPEVAILNTALELRPAEREAYLDKACAGDTALRKQVEALLQAHEQAEDFLNVPPAGLDFNRTEAVNVPVTEKPGDRIGRYKLLQQIGEGGCGVVYMAEQEEPVKRQVALKVIKLGMDTKQVIARFEAERQALALMDHPNIAKVLDAGATETGRPFFVMELVRGIKITEFCDQNQLSTEDRLQLFIQVCQAIQHAHQKGVIHRDIKPSNILVTISEPGAAGIPKVIDFGIAKATAGRLTDQTLFTAFEQFLGTPAYMSPEQSVITSLDIDTRSDIYSLGVLLYELLTGSPPFDQKELLAAGLDEMRRTIREVEPVKPSTRLTQELERTQRPLTPSLSPGGGEGVRRTGEGDGHLKNLIHDLRGDLDWIVMKCLEKDRARRYDTVNGLAADLRRHLDDEPIVARPPSQLYRLQKLVQRHRVGTVTGFVVLLSLLAGLSISIWALVKEKHSRQLAEDQKSRAESNEAKAEIEANRNEKVVRLLQQMLQGVRPSAAQGRDTTVVKEILDRTSDQIGRNLKDEPEVELRLRLILGATYDALGLAQSAATEGERVLALRQTLLGDTHPETLLAMLSLAKTLEYNSKWAVAEPLARSVLAAYREQFGDESLPTADALHVLGNILKRKGEPAEAVVVLREALKLKRTLHGDHNPNLTSVLIALGAALGDNREYEDAARAYEEALELCRRGDGGTRGEAVILDLLGRVRREQGRLEEAEMLLVDSLGIRRLALERDHPEVATSLLQLGDLRVQQKRFVEAESCLQEAWEILGDRQDEFTNKVRGVMNGFVVLYSAWSENDPAKQTLAAEWKQTLGDFVQAHPELSPTRPY